MGYELNLIMIGPPGAGKGTQAERLEQDLHVPFISTGEMLRENVKRGTELGAAAKAHMDAGELVPDDLIVAMIGARLEQRDTRDGFILDGFPRTLAQARALDAQLERDGRHVTAALLLDVPDAVIVRRLAGRRVCQSGGHNYHVDFDPPKRAGVCDQDGAALVQRDDDRPDVVARRLGVYREQTSPLIEFYDERGLLKRVDGQATPAQVHDHLRAVVATLRLEDDV